MKGYNVYSKVHQMREAGFSQRAIAKALGINRKTVKRYWDMDVEQYEHNARKIVRIRNLDIHRDQIVSWLREYPSLSAAQVCDWLKEHYEENHAERTVSRYVKELREEYRLPRHPNPRSYESVHYASLWHSLYGDREYTLHSEAFESNSCEEGKSMRPSRETKEEKFRRLAEARVNKILHLVRLLGNLSWTGTYAYTREQVEQIFTALQSELIKAKLRFLQEQESSKKRFSLSKPYDAEEPKPKNTPMIAIPLPDGTYLRAVGYPDFDYPCINIYWDNGINEPTEPLCFVEFNPDKHGNQRVCIGAYRAEEEDTIYYEPYFTVERLTIRSQA